MIGRSCIIEKKRKKDGIPWVLMISLIHNSLEVTGIKVKKVPVRPPKYPL